MEWQHTMQPYCLTGTELLHELEISHIDDSGNLWKDMHSLHVGNLVCKVKWSAWWLRRVQGRNMAKHPPHFLKYSDELCYGGKAL